MNAVIDKVIITKNYVCLWCKRNEFYVKNVIYDGIYLDLYCTNEECKCRQSIKTDEVEFNEEIQE